MYKWTDGTDYLAHHGIKGQKWGVRRFQNEDGSYTAAGKSRYGSVLSNLKQNRNANPYKQFNAALLTETQHVPDDFNYFGSGSTRREGKRLTKKSSDTSDMVGHKRVKFEMPKKNDFYDPNKRGPNFQPKYKLTLTSEIRKGLDRFAKEHSYYDLKIGSKYNFRDNHPSHPAKVSNDPFWYKKASQSKDFGTMLEGCARAVEIEDRVIDDMRSLENRRESDAARRWLTQEEYYEYLENKWAIELAYRDMQELGDPKLNRRLAAEMNRNREMLAQNEKKFKQKITTAASENMKKETKVHGNAGNMTDRMT